MSLLTPLYALGLLAVSLPVIFHLIRRQPRGEFQFSTLMFLSPSPPRLARRSRLDHLLLLILRGLALSLLAFAFARPFLRSESPAANADTETTRTAIIIDASASMRRGDLWQQATAAVDNIIADRKLQDEIALYACDETLRPVITFESMAQIAPVERRSVISSRLKELQPTWAATHLGQGLMDAVEIVTSNAEARDSQRHIARRIVLVSDIQSGSRLNALADFPWPEDLQLELRSVSPAKKTNAGIHYVTETDKRNLVAPSTEVRVRVSNDAESTVDEFKVTWLDKSGKPLGDPTPAYVPAGESRIIRVPQLPKPATADRLRLTGDDFDFDNTLYLATGDDVATANVIYVGDDRADDPQSLRFYLERALTEGLSRPVTLTAMPAEKPLAIESPTTTPLVVVTNSLTSERVADLRKFADSGGNVLAVLKESQPIGELPKLVGTSAIDVEEAKPDNYTMLSQIDFSHPLFAPMSGPHFNDFTQIHFWKYRRLKPEQLGNATLVARFENGDAAVVDWVIGKGHVYALTSGWHPADSQLARSWKFVLLVSALFNANQVGQQTRAFFTINEPVPIPAQPKATTRGTVIKPDGSTEQLDSNARTFNATSEPGLYTLSIADKPQQFAVNLDPLESKTAALGSESLEQLGVRLVNLQAPENVTAKNQRLQDVQLESRQKYWRWLVVAVLVLLVAETWLAGRASRHIIAEGTPA